MQTVQSELKSGEQLLKRHPSDRAVGVHSKRIAGLIEEGDRLQRDYCPLRREPGCFQCARLGDFAHALWWHGMVGMYNNGHAAEADYRRAKADYEDIVGRCRNELR